MVRKILFRGVLIISSLVVAAQFVPFGRKHTNPQVRVEPQWDSSRTRELAQRACFDCHSNETRWPWYSHVAPASWLVEHDVTEGRSMLNFSEWERPQKEAHEAAEEVQEGAMPLKIYLPFHPEARLSHSEKQELIRGLQATIGGSGQIEEAESDEEGEE